jgi:hypothetical protein
MASLELAPVGLGEGLVAPAQALDRLTTLETASSED